MDTKNEGNNVEQSIPELVPSQVFEMLQTSEDGLTTDEVTKRLMQYGKNTIKEKQGKPLY
ncbi:MAG: cation-transporting P-type ATPase, partial [Bacillus sp. (in: firmicutes)]